LSSYLDALQGAGLDTVPGTGAHILNDRIRNLRLGGSELSSHQWIDAISTFHRHGVRTTATIVYGHIESPAEIVAHLRSLIAIQDATGGFTELIPMPFVRADAPNPNPRVAGNGASVRDSRAMYAVARLMLLGRIDHIQASWTKLGVHGAKEVLRGGADDLGGTFTAGYRMPAAGAEAGLELTSSDMARIIGEIDRLPRQRTTTYESASEERVSSASRAAASFRSGPSATPKYSPLIAR
jgi:FO synthase